MDITKEDCEELRLAKKRLESPGLLIKLSHRFGTPIEKGFKLLPADWRTKLEQSTQKALLVSLKSALLTMNHDAPAHKAAPHLHTLAATVSGGVGGVFGLPGLLLELPISTTIMLRSIADIAQSMGEDLANPESQLACLEVFALGGRVETDNAAESGYLATRSALAQAAKEASRYLASHATLEKSAPSMVKFIAKIAARFQIQLSEKAAAMAIPAISAVGGSVINYMFIDHFQTMSKGHFTVRALEKKYGSTFIQQKYNEIDTKIAQVPVENMPILQNKIIGPSL